MNQGTAQTADREARLGDILAAWLEAVEAGQASDRAAWLARYPEFAAELTEFFADHDELHAVAAPLRNVAQAANTPATQQPGGMANHHPRLAPEASSFGDYELLEVLGQGGMGIVYKARQKSLNRTVALKMIRADRLASPEQVRRIRNEAEAVAALDHPGVVPIYEVGECAGQPFFTMKLLEGGNLAGGVSALADKVPPKAPPVVAGAEVLRSPGAASPGLRSTSARATPFTTEPRTAARLLAQVALAVHHAHQRGILHRDLKPSNILLDAEGRPHVADFGLAKWLTGDSSLTGTGAVVGTPSYTAPEQASANARLVTTAADIYGLGAILYALLTGRPPFQGETPLDTLDRVRQEEPVAPRRLNRAIPADLETIVAKAMDKNPEARYGTAKEMAEDLERFLRDEPIKARRPGLMRRLRGWCRRHALVVTALGVLVVTLLLLGGIALWWTVRERVTTAQAVADDLQNAALWQGQERWTEALQALERARGRLEGSGQESLVARVEERRREVAFVVRLREAQQKASSASSNGKRDYGEADRLFATAFVENGLDVAALTPEEIARKIQASPIPSATLTGLDHWAYVKEHLQHGDAKRLLAIVRLADDDKSRHELREPNAAREWIVLKRLLEAMDIQPENGEQYLNLGRFMKDQHRPTEAIAACRKALELELDSAQATSAHEVIAFALKSQGKQSAAVATIRTAIELQPSDSRLHYILGLYLYEQWKLPQAERAYRKVIALRPQSSEFGVAYHDLGCVLYLQGKLSQAEEASRMAINLQPRFPNAFNTLENILRAQRRFSEADAAQQTAIEFNNVAADCNLGYLLMGQGRFTEALAAFKRGDELNSRRPRQQYNTVVLIRWAEQWVQLDAKLPKVMMGEAQPADAAEGVALAELCQLRSRQLYAASAHFYAEAFAADPKLVGELRAGIRYGAACAAAQAGCGQGKDAVQLDAKEHARLRGQALTWLRADLTGWRSEWDQNADKARNGVRYEMQQWRQDVALGGVRREEDVAKLPEAERQEWRALWQEVEELARRAGEPK